MVAQDIEYVELYATDANAAISHFSDALGFTPVAGSTGPGTESVLLRQGTVQIVVTEGPAVADYLDLHGDGFADIALICDDVDDTRRRALSAGARPARGPGDGAGPAVSAVSAFGDVRHTLLGPRAPGEALRLPPGRTWIPRDGSRPQAAGVDHVIRLDHVAVCLEAGTLADYTELYVQGFGLPVYSGEYVTFADQAMDSKVVRSLDGGVTFTLIEPDRKKQAGQIDAFLDGNSGPGVQHLAFLVDDIVASVQDLSTRGVRFLRTPGAYYDKIAERYPDFAQADTDRLRAAHVLVDRDEWGELLQIFTGSPFPRDTLFSELVQRRGSRGFGASNIKALYEAIETDRSTAGG